MVPMVSAIWRVSGACEESLSPLATFTFETHGQILLRVPPRLKSVAVNKSLFHVLRIKVSIIANQSVIL